MVMYDYLKKITSAFSISEHLFSATTIIPFPGRVWPLACTQGSRVMSQTETGLHLRDTMARMRNPLISPGPQNVTLRYFYTLASHFNCLLLIFLPLIQQCLAMYMGQISINRLTKKLTPCVWRYYTETNILHFKSRIFVHPHHLEIIRTRHTRVTQYQWHIEGTTLKK